MTLDPSRRAVGPTRIPATLAIISVLVLAACGGGTQAPATGDAGETQAAETTAAETEAAATDAGDGDGGGETHNVSLEGFAFDPAELTIAVGDTVVFENLDSAPHTATHGENGEAAEDAAFDEELPEQGDTAEVTFDEAGEFPTTCTIHPQMNMTITVEGA